MKQDLGDGHGLWTNQILGLTPELDTTVEGLPYDPDEAKKLLDEAKAEGYDGKITLTCDATPERERKAISIQAQSLFRRPFGGKAIIRWISLALATRLA